VVTWPEQLGELVKQHCRERGYSLLDDTLRADGYRYLSIGVPDHEEPVRLEFNGELFLLHMPGGYHWQEFAYEDEDRTDALSGLLEFLDAYVDPATVEVAVSRMLGGARRELRVSNGAVLRLHGWSRSPTRTT
jgi:hypothetical protein